MEGKVYLGTLNFRNSYRDYLTEVVSRFQHFKRPVFNIHGLYKNHFPELFFNYFKFFGDFKKTKVNFLENFLSQDSDFEKKIDHILVGGIDDKLELLENYYRKNSIDYASGFL